MRYILLSPPAIPPRCLFRRFVDDPSFSASLERGSSWSSAAKLLADWRAGTCGADAAGVVHGGGGGGSAILDEIGDPHLPGGRAAAPGHVRSQAERPAGDRGTVAAGGDQRSRHSDL